MYPYQSSLNTQRVVADNATLGIISAMKWYDRAKSRMKDLGITQEELAPLLGVETRGAVGHWLSGRREPSLSQFALIAKILKFASLDELMFGDASEMSQAIPPGPTIQGEILTPEEKNHLTMFRRANPETRAAVQAIYGIAKQTVRLKPGQYRKLHK